MTVKYTKQEQVAIQLAKDVVIGATIQATIENGIKELRVASKGKELGTVKSGDARMIRIQETLQASKGKDGKVLSEQTVKNYMTAIRKAYNENKPFSMNAYRAKVSKGSQAGKGKTTATAGVKFKGDATLDDIVKGLRSMFNKFKENDKTTSLASYLIDALDDFEGESK
jgi:hypothetical protein